MTISVFAYCRKFWYPYVAESRLAGKLQLRWAVPITDFQILKQVKLASFRKRRAGLSLQLPFLVLGKCYSVGERHAHYMQNRRLF